MRALDIRPDLPRRGMRGQERPAPKHPPLWRNATTYERLDGPSPRGFYRLSTWAYNSCCRLQQYGPTQVCVMGDFGFLVVVWLEGDLR